MKIGVNTFGLGPSLRRDAASTWQQLREAGVTAIEPCVAVTKDPPKTAEEQAVWDKGVLDGIFVMEEARKLIPSLRRMGFEVFSFQMQASPFSADAVARFIPFMREFGLHDCIYSFMERSVTKIRAQKNEIEQATHMLREMGMEFLAHNHDMEWLPDEGTCVMRWLLDEIPDLRFEIDLGWTEYAGVSSVSILKQYPDRFPLLHIKEIDKGAKAWTGKPFCTVPGTGILPLHEILDTAKTMPLSEHAFILDQDDAVSGNIVSDISMGIRNIRRMV